MQRPTHLAIMVEGLWSNLCDPEAEIIIGEASTFPERINCPECLKKLAREGTIKSTL